MQPQAGPAGLQRAPAAEQQLWTYLTQLAMALRALHTAGLAVGSAGLAATKVLLTSRATARIKIGIHLQRNTTCHIAGAAKFVVLHLSQLIAHAFVAACGLAAKLITWRCRSAGS